jgi:CMP-N,N'-diacetyllegionaminic acid synthase
VSPKFVKSSLGIIPARGGSKGLPRKNVLPLLGKPLIAYTIEAALHANSLGRVVVSTDDPETAEIAGNSGADVPFLRPSELAQDNTPTLDVVRHVLANLKTSQSYEPEIVVVLQPTSPLRRPADIDRAVAKLQSTEADSVVSLCTVDHNPHWMMRLQGDRVLPFIEDGREYVRRQDLPAIYRMNGAIYVTRTDLIVNQKRLLGEDTRGYVMDQESSIDIDTALDMEIAALLLQRRQNERFC